MGQSKAEFCKIQGLVLIHPKVHEDARGYFMETYQEKELAEFGIAEHFVQDNEAKSTKGVLRGLHFQKNYPQAKLIRCIQGQIYDVAVDLRNGSPTFGQWFGALLSEENKNQLYLPKGFAHGYYVLSETALIAYKCTDFYHPEDEDGIRYDDAELQIDWPIPVGTVPVLSERDKKAQSFAEYKEKRF
ncbi:MAG: dTDP-4-dehydrorhamnose 3,5-epimerase [Lachnospiraceae bacterium]